MGCGHPPWGRRTALRLPRHRERQAVSVVAASVFEVAHPETSA
jgi:hypothetical protein